MKKDKWGDFAKPKKPYSQQFAIPQIPDGAYQKKLREQETCAHLEFEKIYTDTVHWRLVCLNKNCRKQFSSEIIEETHGEEILI